jgi:hypothetical protein
MSPLQHIASDGLADWLDLPPWPTADSIRLQQEADEYQREQIETAQNEAAHQAALVMLGAHALAWWGVL